MRRDRFYRFLVFAFAIGAFIGLVSGLAFGGGPDTGTSKVTSATEGDSDDSSTASSDAGSSSGEPMTADMAKTIGANEMGQILVVMYHLIDSEEGTYTRTPDNFRADIALLKAEGYYPINLRDLASGNIDIPAGKSPVVITFDDSSSGQYRILEDGSLDPDCAVGILQKAATSGDWASRASFFCLIEVDSDDREIFGQEDRQQEKVRNLVDWGYEVGSHTVTHLNLSEASTEEATKQLAQSQSILEKLIGGSYAVTSISLPFGEYPDPDALLKSGTYEDISYEYTAAASIASRPCASPFSTEFQALHIPRITGSASYLSDAVQNFKDHPELRYISDGDPTTVSAPTDLDSKLGELSDMLGRPVIRY